MSKDLCDILVLAYCAANGRITHMQVSASPARGRSSAKTPNYSSRLRLLKKYHFLKGISADTCVLTVQGLVYVEEHSLAPPEVIQRDQRLRAGLLLVAEAVRNGDAEYGAVWNKAMIADGYTQEEIEGRQSYLHCLRLL